MSRINQHIIEHEEKYPEELAEVRDEQEKDLAYQQWCDERETETRVDILERNNHGEAF